MKLKRHVVVLDCPDLDVESTFWSTLLDGTVSTDEDWHTVFVDGEPLLEFQLVPHHVAPDWPDGEPQQLHLDLYVDDIRSSHDEAVAAGARLLQGADLDLPHGFQVYADPAGHPFCLCWGS